MHILVLNAGSSSLKADILNPSGERFGKLRAQRLGTPQASWTLNGDPAQPAPDADHGAVLAQALPGLLKGGTLAAVGHRVVHGGERFTRPTRIDDEVVAAIEALSDLAPLHNPANLAGIRAAMEQLPHLPHVAVFDTAFHATLPARARGYALPAHVSEQHGLRRYGFHGPSHSFVSHQAAAWLGEDIRDLRIISCHLGNGASVCAVEYGRSVETSMGFTPLEGLVMGTRSGDVDPGILIKLLRSGMSVDELDELLNRQSGLAGVSGRGNDMRDIEDGAGDGDEACRTALHLLTHRLRKYIGAYAAVMGGVDAIVFTAGIGENSALVRHRACQRLGFLGARLDEDRNRDAKVGINRRVAEISSERSRVRLLVVATDEARAIAQDTAALVEGQNQVLQPGPIPVGISARHVHLTQEMVEALFGEGHTLTPLRPLSQPGQFACEERVTLVGPKRSISRVRILGPARSRNQVEISRTDEFHLGIDAPVRASGDTRNTPGITLISDSGRQVQLDEGVICAWRHIHMTPADAEAYGVQNGDVVDVAIDSEGRDLVFGDVMVRVKDSYKLELHLDTDEANAADLCRGATGVLIEDAGMARLLRRRI